MLYPSVDEIKKASESRYALVILAAKRARDIVEGAPILVEGGDSEKAVTAAVSEIAAGEIKCGNPEENMEIEMERSQSEMIEEIFEDVKAYSEESPETQEAE